jgi:hypothetical protein
MTYIERIVNADTNEVIEQNYTKAQLDEVEDFNKKLKAQQVAETQKATDKAALLTKLGITSEEAALLLG